MICLQGLHFDSPNLQDSFNLALFCGIHEKYAMWKFIVDVVNDFVSSLQPDVGRGFLHVSNVFLLDLVQLILEILRYIHAILIVSPHFLSGRIVIAVCTQGLRYQQGRY